MLSLIVSFHGCRATGTIMSNVESLRLNLEVTNRAYESSTNSINKGNEKLETKNHIK